MKISDLIVSKYLKKEDFPAPALLTVKAVEKVDVSVPGDEPQEKGVMHFKERNKPMVLNTTNLNRAVRIFGSDETEDWKNKRVIVYVDETIEFGGKIIGGLRLRPPATKTLASVRQSENPAEYGDIDL